MRAKGCRFVLAVAMLVWSAASSSTFAQSQNAVTQSANAAATPAPPSAAGLEGVQHKVQLQLIVASNAAQAKTDLPSALETAVKQLKGSMPFKNHRLIATYIYNIADGGSLSVNDTTYASFEMESGTPVPAVYTFDVLGIKSVLNGESVRISRLRFELRRRLVLEPARNDGINTVAPKFDSANSGITTELSVRSGIPTIVGTVTSGLSDGVLVLVVTVDSTVR
jgi:hypothetical protein